MSKQDENDIFSREAYRKSANKRAICQLKEDALKNEQLLHENELSEYEEYHSEIDGNNTETYYYENKMNEQDSIEHRQVSSNPSFNATLFSKKDSREYQGKSHRKTEHENSVNVLPPKKKAAQGKKAKKKKRRRGCGCLGILLFMILLIAGYCIGFFIKGQNDAHSESPESKTHEFHGVTADSGAKNIVLIGNDSRDGENARADTIMILSFDGKNKTPKIISVMRDSYVKIPGHGATKINASFAYGEADGTGGEELLRQTLEKSLKLPLQYYVTVDFKAFEKVVDALYPDGVAIDAEKDMDLDGVFIKKGPQIMHGHKLLQYARFRHDAESDFGRIRRQQQVMTAIFSKLKSPTSILRFPYVAGKAIGYTSNNIPLSYYLKISYGMLKGSHDIKRLSVPVDKTWDFGYTADGESVIYFDDDENAKAIKAFLEK